MPQHEADRAQGGGVADAVIETQVDVDRAGRKRHRRAELTQVDDAAAEVVAVDQSRLACSSARAAPTHHRLGAWRRAPPCPRDSLTARTAPASPAPMTTTSAVMPAPARAREAGDELRQRDGLELVGARITATLLDGAPAVLVVGAQRPGARARCRVRRRSDDLATAADGTGSRRSPNGR
ncbi:MAG: hypothetical protein U0168_24925 [Nannocystaceae bacterium]